VTGYVKRHPRALVRCLGWRHDTGPKPAGVWMISYLDDRGNLVHYPNGRVYLEPQDGRVEALDQAARSVAMMRGTPGGFLPKPGPVGGLS
jgi:hypothetical protein